MRSGTIDQFSVGFRREADEHVDPDDVDGRSGVMDIVKGHLTESSLVIEGAVPGTQLVSVRSGGVVPASSVIDLGRQVAAGTLSHEEAEASLRLMADTDGDPVVEPTAGEVLAVAEVDADAALQGLAEID
jgi:phage head maturation protease